MGEDSSITFHAIAEKIWNILLIQTRHIHCSSQDEQFENWYVISSLTFQGMGLFISAQIKVNLW